MFKHLRDVTEAAVIETARRPIQPVYGPGITRYNKDGKPQIETRTLYVPANLGDMVVVHLGIQTVRHRVTTDDLARGYIDVAAQKEKICPVFLRPSKLRVLAGADSQTEM